MLKYSGSQNNNIRKINLSNKQVCYLKKKLITLKVFLCAVIGFSRKDDVLQKCRISVIYS